uniref:Uncharacterized protein n=1 Tax=Arundo donax TaxID=35708 RepID=A0A0A9C6W4_ARUDO
MYLRSTQECTKQCLILIFIFFNMQQHAWGKTSNKNGVGRKILNLKKRWFVLDFI